MLGKRKFDMFADEGVRPDVPDLPNTSEEPKCEKVWNRGRDYDNFRDDTFPIVLKDAQNCRIPIGDKIAFVSLPKETEWLNIYLRSIERLTPNQLVNRNGVFTWIFYRKNGSSELRFAASQVHSSLETGTLHRAIARFVGADTIHGAGEMKKVGNHIEFNFESGSYVLDWVNPKDVSCTPGEMESYLDPLFRQQFPGMTFSQHPKTFIGQKETPLTMEELQLYADAHFIVCLHNKNDVATCRQTRGTCDSPLKSRL